MKTHATMLNKYNECFGSITKEETLRSIDIKSLPNTFVLETQQPFSGYYSNTPGNKSPHSIFLILSGAYSYERINRATNKIKGFIGFDFDATKAEISMDNTSYTSIRLYALTDYSVIPQIQEAYIADGIKMHSGMGHTEGSAIITLLKVFLIEEFGTGLYINRGKSKMGYIEVGKNINFSQFKTATKTVKNNWDSISFDAAQGHFNRRKGVTDIVRIYSENISERMVEEIAKLYIKAYESF